MLVKLAYRAVKQSRRVFRCFGVSKRVVLLDICCLPSHFSSAQLQKESEPVLRLKFATTTTETNWTVSSDVGRSTMRFVFVCGQKEKKLQD